MFIMSNEKLEQAALESAAGTVEIVDASDTTPILDLSQLVDDSELSAIKTVKCKLNGSEFTVKIVKGNMMLALVSMDESKIALIDRNSQLTPEEFDALPLNEKVEINTAVYEYNSNTLKQFVYAPTINDDNINKLSSEARNVILSAVDTVNQNPAEAKAVDRFQESVEE